MKKLIIPTVLIIAGLLSVSFITKFKAEQETKGLKDYYKKYFAMGVAVTPRNLLSDEKGLILKEFNSITPENAMKMGPIHPEENRYFWSDADSIVAFAVRNKIKVRGHTLCWHSQAPSWFFTDAAGTTFGHHRLPANRAMAAPDHGLRHGLGASL